MIGFLFGCAAGLAVGCVLGALAAAVYEERMGREIDRVFKDRPPKGVDFFTTRVGPVDRFRPHLDAPERMAAGVKVCSCIGALRGPHFVDPECPFHGGAA